MNLLEIYECLCDSTRLRIVNLLTQGPLCVCHFQELLDEPQVKISKHLAYLKARRLVEARRDANWMVYSLPANPTAELKANLACLRDCGELDATLKKDIARLRKSQPRFEQSSPICCAPMEKRKSKSVA
jgi:ArsR family transcriptional regulator